MPAISVSLKTDTLYDLERAVERTGWNKSKIAEEALKRFFSELAEDSEDARLGEEAYARFKASGEKAIPADVVYKELGL
ncbi:MAG: hypothetical protein K2N58_05310 [Treponemataceae bacterium]|nr:hypothetical protein [Treponemataceae bacterium]MDE7291446.1 hypothetical protein [Treponemataceae bacterium]